jgi:tripartite-type tricarboxylate transporter receptor subunit TctC
MLRSRFVAWMLVPGTLISSVITVSAQTYPYKPLRILASEPGGSSDAVARLIAQTISQPLGQQVIVENRPGALVGELVVKTLPDGYTLFVLGTPFWIAPLIHKMNYDPVRDFAPVSMLTKSPSVLAVHPSLPAKSVKELIVLAKAKPGVLNYGSGLSGTAPHLAAELFKAMAGVNIVRIPYKGTGPALGALIGGETDLMLSTAGSTMPHVKAGRLRALAVASAQPSALVPELPTIAATVPGYESSNMNGMFVPAKTSAAIIAQLNREVLRVLDMQAVKDKFFSSGVEVAGGLPQALTATIKSEMLRLGKVIKDVGITEEKE